jgi:hypothetical protein
MNGTDLDWTDRPPAEQKGKLKMEAEIVVDEIRLKATLDENTTAERIAAMLPVEGKANRWGDEIYFSIPLEIALADDAVADVDVGTLAYWPTGSALCLFFGPTPVSSTDRPRAYSPVNVFGRIDGDPSALRDVSDGALVTVRRCDGM